ncbi:MAG: hypothetical protein V2J10_03310 [Wenzhouxiangella sp.]|jgi:hypothetical protein|nr:hypothetical protein [Wenzhouxiangella sp.]
MTQESQRQQASRPGAWSWFLRIARQRQQFHIALAGTVGGVIAAGRGRASRREPGSHPVLLGEEVVR